MLLSPEEIKERWLEGYREQNLTADEFNLDNLSDHLYFEDMHALKAIAKAQLKKVVGWGDERCLTDFTGGHQGRGFLKRQCLTCWQSLLKEVE